jgi:hypothetical protein
MIILEPPFPGYFQDLMCWGECHIRHEIEELMLWRVANGLRRLKFYADKIFNSCTILTAAFSLRHGELQPWMVQLNRLMSPIRVCIEWCFGKTIA